MTLSRSSTEPCIQRACRVTDSRRPRAVVLLPHPCDPHRPAGHHLRDTRRQHLPDEGRTRQCRTKRQPGLDTESTVRDSRNRRQHLLDVRDPLCRVLFEAHRRWGSLGLRTALRPGAVSGASCVAIVACCVPLFGLSHLGHSRAEQIAAAALVLTIAFIIHGLFLTIGRVVDITALVKPAWRPMLMTKR